MDEVELYPSKIRYCQDSIKREFQNGVSLTRTVRYIKQGIYSVDDLPSVTVYRYKRKWFTDCNRRLWVLQQLEDDGYLDTITADVIDKDYVPARKKTTENNGRSIRIRQGSAYESDSSSESDSSDESETESDTDSYYSDDDGLAEQFGYFGIY